MSQELHDMLKDLRELIKEKKNDLHTCECCGDVHDHLTVTRDGMTVCPECEAVVESYERPTTNNTHA